MADGNCSFCGKQSTEVFRLISNDGTKICSECIGRCANIIADELKTVAREINLPPRNGDPM